MAKRVHNGEVVDDFVHKLQGTIQNPNLKSQDTYAPLRDLAIYFISRVDPEKIEAGAEFHPDGNRINYADYLEGIVGALSCVVEHSNELFYYGTKLVDITGKVYCDGAHSSYFAKTVLPALVKCGTAATGKDLVAMAQTSEDNRNGKPGELYYPQLVETLNKSANSFLDRPPCQ